MDIRNGLDGLKSFWGVSSPAPATPEARSSPVAGGSALGSDRATLSNAGSEVSLTAADPGVRTGTVSVVQAALAAGTYNVPTSAVASKVLDSMLGNAQ